jgi:hypothetical protein
MFAIFAVQRQMGDCFCSTLWVNKAETSKLLPKLSDPPSRALAYVMLKSEVGAMYECGEYPKYGSG